MGAGAAKEAAIQSMAQGYLPPQIANSRRDDTIISARREARRRVKAKIAAVAAFQSIKNKHTENNNLIEGGEVKRPEAGDDNLGFLSLKHRESTEIWNMLKENDEFTSPRYTRTARTALEEITESDMSDMSDDDWDDDKEVNCHFCNEMSTFNGYACRVCPKSFHKKCLEKSGKMKPRELDLMDELVDTESWSCYDCDNLELLLRETEVADMMDIFDKIDNDGDGEITMNEYIKANSNIYGKVPGHPGMEEDMKTWIMDFHRIDVDHSGSLDWQEWVKHEARKYLARRDEDDLVSVLSKKEKRRARAVYEKYVKDTKRSNSKTVHEKRIKGWKEYLKEEAFTMILDRRNKWPNT